MDPAIAQTFTSPVVLFFLLGILAGLARSDLAIPEAIAKGLSLYLMAAIGLKGGVAVAQSGLSFQMLIILGAGIAASFGLPFIANALLRGFGRLSAINAGAIAAHYGSVSVVTYVTAVEILGARGTPPEGYMVAVLAAMETPAILAGLMLARSGDAKAGGKRGELLHEVFLNASVVLLLGAFFIGTIAGPAGFSDVAPFFEAGFKGVLCLFLLDMGLIAARRLLSTRAMTWRLALIAIGLPLLNGTLGTVAVSMVGVDVGTVAAFGVLCASASYIAVPAAMRLALPEADPGLYLTMSLSITFPFNILVNIGLIATLASVLAKGT
ncbi:MAG: sodium-dependent bicarbonate transport family permease [Pontixanthobacter sp.]